MNTKKIAFIICVNDETYYRECLFYLNRLSVPDGFSLEVYAVREADTIFAAYNEAMQKSEAKYKIYMHQDVFLIEQDILVNLLKLFEKHPRIGMVGLLGATGVPSNRRFYRAWDVGNVIGCNDNKAFHNELGKEAAEVFAIDGMFMMTQYDIPWREDRLKGWDFYDFSQSIEFRRRGYEIWVPRQEHPWSIHDCGVLNLSMYDQSQQDFLRLYKDELGDYLNEPEVYRPEYRKRLQLVLEVKEQMKKLLFWGHTEEVRKTLERLWDERFCDTELMILKNILEIMKEEHDADYMTNNFLEDCNCFTEAYEKWTGMKFNLRRRKYAPEAALDMGSASEIAQRIVQRHVMLT